MWFDIFTDTGARINDPWRWRLIAGEVVLATSARGYPSEDDCRTAVADLLSIPTCVPIETRAGAQERLPKKKLNGERSAVPGAARKVQSRDARQLYAVR